MLAFDPPAGFRDISEYRFAAEGRSLSVRTSSAIGSAADLMAIAQDYAKMQADYLAAHPSVSSAQTRPDGAPYVLVTSTSPGPAGPADAGGTLIERSAFLLLQTGVCVQLALSARSDDAGVDAEFEHLVMTLRPATATRGSRTLTATGGAACQAGPVWIDLPPAYRDITVMTFQDAADRRLTVNVAGASGAGSASRTTGPAASAATPRFLRSVQTGIDAHGKAFGYEVGPDPWAARGGTAPASSPGIAPRSEAPAGAARIDVASGSGSTTASSVRDMEDQQVVVHVQSPRPDPDAQRMAEEVARSIRSVR